MKEINVISSDLDGAQLQREKATNFNYVRCKGKNDEAEIQEAINHIPQKRITIPGERWDAIFGGK